MTEDADPRPPEESDPLDIELRLVREAVWMVASGAARRVVLAGLHCANEILGTAGEVALEPGVRLLPLWRPDERGVDIAVEVASGAVTRPEQSVATVVPKAAR
jgi:hypothetical protein